MLGCRVAFTFRSSLTPWLRCGPPWSLLSDYRELFTVALGEFWELFSSQLPRGSLAWPYRISSEAQTDCFSAKESRELIVRFLELFSAIFFSPLELFRNFWLPQTLWTLTSAFSTYWGNWSSVWQPLPASLVQMWLQVEN